MSQMRKGIDRRHVLAAGLAMPFLMRSHGVIAAEAAGQVTEVKGTAHALTAGVQRELQKAGSIFVDDTVVTGEGARLALRLGQSTHVKLGAAAKLKIDRYIQNAAGEFEIGSGAMWFDRNGAASKATAQFRSAYGLIAVRGTQFFAGPSNGVFGVFVESGMVDVSAAGKTVRLTKGLGTNIAAPGDAPSDAADWKQERIRAALASVM